MGSGGVEDFGGGVIHIVSSDLSISDTIFDAGSGEESGMGDGAGGSVSI